MIILDKDQSAQLLSFKNWYHINFKKSDINISFKTNEEVLHGYDTVVFEHMEYTGIEIDGVRLKDIVYRMLELSEVLMDKKEYKKILIDMSNFTYDKNTYLERLFRSLASYFRSVPIFNSDKKPTIQFEKSKIKDIL